MCSGDLLGSAENEIWLYTDGIDAETLSRFHFQPVDQLEKAIEQLLERFGPNARWAIVPDGPMLILRVA